MNNEEDDPAENPSPEEQPGETEEAYPPLELQKIEEADFGPGSYAIDDD